MTSPGVAATAAGAAAVAGAALYYACSWPTSQWLGPGLVRGPATACEVALTFDDGPAVPYSNQILDILKRYRVPATFFCCGKNVLRFPDVVRRMVAEGHTVGNHTFSHPLLYFKRRADIESEIDSTQDAIRGVTARRPTVFRPPYGARWFGLFPALKARGLADVQWSDTGYDWIRRNSPADIARKALAKLSPGAVLLLHDGREPRRPSEVDASATVAALPAVLEGARAAGYEFVPLGRFLDAA